MGQNDHGEECGCRLIICNATSRSKQFLAICYTERLAETGAAGSVG